MILIADSGSTKTDWVGVENYKEILNTRTMGFNPFLHSVENIVSGITENTEVIGVSDSVDHLYYYGAGCSSEDLIKIVVTALKKVFVNAEISVKHDTLASALATYSGEPGISCILGTGSNSCYFDGENIKEEVPALGYVMGDEGSGSYFGKNLLRDFLYKKMPKDLAQTFQEKYSLDKDEILENVLSKPFANVYMASFSHFMYDIRDTDYISGLIKSGFKEFLTYHVQCFADYQKLPVHFIGSISHFYEKELREVADGMDINVGTIIQKPISGLVNYHIKYQKNHIS
ncbi:MAG: glucosamine kinase [Patiriisocius sp.]|jgi:glucosamine kinase